MEGTFFFFEGHSSWGVRFRGSPLHPVSSWEGHWREETHIATTRVLSSSGTFGGSLSHPVSSSEGHWSEETHIVSSRHMVSVHRGTLFRGSLSHPVSSWDGHLREEKHIITTQILSSWGHFWRVIVLSFRRKWGTSLVYFPLEKVHTHLSSLGGTSRVRQYPKFHSRSSINFHFSSFF